ncbi:MAG: glycoside-pentoside-hexuronide (GPH):cation symporter [Novosphingobium sp.]
MALLTAREKYSYASGEIASNLGWNMVAGFLLLYYSDVALLPVAGLGTLMLVTRVLDAVFDPGVGLLVDRTRTRFGKSRPYILFAALPFAAMMVATFSVPGSLSPEGKLLYAYVTFTLLGLLYSLLYIPYSALLPMMTRDPGEKVQLGSLRSMGTSLASIIVYGLTIPLVAWIGGENRQHGFTMAAVIMAAITAGLYFVVVANCQERYSAPADAQAVPARTSLRQMIRNPIWLLVFAFAMAAFVKIGIMVSSLAFFSKDVLGTPWMISVLLPLLSVAILSGGFIAGFVFRRVTKRIGNIVALTATLVPLCLMPFAQGHAPLFIALFTLANVTGGIQGATIFILLADSVEEHDRRFGNRAEGLLVSSVSFGMKVGMAIGTALTGYALAWAGYDPAHATPGANMALSWLFYGGQIALTLVQIACISLLREPPVLSAAPSQS